MNTAAPEPVDHARMLTPELVRALPWDRGRGTSAMGWVIASEVMVFIALFFSYFYSAQAAPRWPPHQPPSPTLPLIITAILAVSCGILEWGRRALNAGRSGGARIALLLALLSGGAYLWLEVQSIRQYLPVVTPQQDAYGSLYYTILGVHGLHLVAGMLLLAFAWVLPLEPTRAPPHRPYLNSALYWYFCAFAWLPVLIVLYLLPRLHR